MAFFINEKEDCMVDYSDIRNAYIAYDEAKSKYWSDLESAIRTTYTGFAAYLNITDKFYYDRKECKNYYLRLGVYNGDKFEEKDSSFSRNGEKLSIPFALSITLDKSEEFFPKHNLILLLEVSKKNGLFIYEIINKDKIKKIDSQESLFRELVEDIFDQINPKQF